MSTGSTSGQTSPVAAEDAPSTADRIEEVQQDLDSLIEDAEDLQEPIAEFELFDECMYLIGSPSTAVPAAGTASPSGATVCAGDRHAAAIACAPRQQ